MTPTGQGHWPACESKGGHDPGSLPIPGVSVRVFQRSKPNRKCACVLLCVHMCAFLCMSVGAHVYAHKYACLCEYVCVHSESPVQSPQPLCGIRSSLLILRADLLSKLRRGQYNCPWMEIQKPDHVFLPEELFHVPEVRMCSGGKARVHSAPVAGRSPRPSCRPCFRDWRSL